MDRTASIRKFLRLFLAWVPIVASSALALGSALSTRADTVLMTAPTAPMQSDYPESRFGYQPSQVREGIGPSYAAKATDEMDEEAMDLPADARPGPAPRTRTTARRPAGLEFNASTAQVSGEQEVTRPIRQNTFGVNDEFNREYRGNPDNPVAGAMANPMLLKGVQEVAVIASDLGYFPKTLFVVRDLPVRMYVTGASRNTLCIMMDSFQVRKQVRSQKIEEITFTPATPGKYRFYCPVNGMEGTLVVKELTRVVPGDLGSGPGGDTQRTARGE